MRRVDLITDVPFWTAARGDASRIRSLAQFLAARTALRVVLLAKPGQLPDPLTRGQLGAGQFHMDLVIVLVDPRSPAQGIALLQTVFAESRASVALVEYVHLTWILDVLPSGIRTFLDTHQIAHERNERFVAAGLPAPSVLDEAAEYAAYGRYDRVILIQQEDRDIVARRLGIDRLLLAPHPVRLRDTEVRTRASSVGFVGSEYAPNVQGLNWFLNTVWPRISDAHASLEIYGGVAHRMVAATLPANARCHGKVANIDAAYRAMDVAINPVQVGAGLKIKTVEALGAGLPLVTTPEGARGIRDAAGEAFLMANDEYEFAAHLSRLLASYDLRRQLAVAARRLAAERFSPEICFGPLLRAIEEQP